MDGTLHLRRTALFLGVDALLRDPPVLRGLSEQLRGRLAVITGRRISAVDQMVRRCVTCVAGAHGRERRNAAGEIENAAAHPRLGDAAEVLAALANARAGLQLHRRDASVTIDYHEAPEAESAVLETVQRLAGATGLEMARGEAAAELRPAGPSKAQALRSFMNEAPFTGTAPLILGDDLSDEPAFQEAAYHGGWSILVGPPRESRAHFRLPDAAAARAWLARGLERGAFDLRAATWVA